MLAVSCDAHRHGHLVPSRPRPRPDATRVSSSRRSEELLGFLRGYGVSAVCDAWEGGRPVGPRITKTEFGEVEAYDSSADAFVIRCLDDVYGELDITKTWLVKRRDLQYMLAGSYREEVKRSGRHILDRSWSFRDGCPPSQPAVCGQRHRRSLHPSSRRRRPLRLFPASSSRQLASRAAGPVGCFSAVPLALVTTATSP